MKPRYTATRVLLGLAYGCLLVVPRAAAPQDLEPNNQLDDAVETGLAAHGSVTVTGAAITPFGPSQAPDVDLYRFTVPQPPRWRMIRATLDSAGSGLDGYLRLFNSSGVELTNDDDRNYPDPDPVLRTFVYESGAYYIGVSASPNSVYDPSDELDTRLLNATTGGYALTIQVAPFAVPASPFEPNDIEADATDVSSIGYSAFGEFIGDGPNGRSDVDVYKVSVAGPAIINATARADKYFDSTLDPLLYVSNIGVSGDASLDTHDASLKFAVFDPGDYYLQVRGAGNAPHVYATATPSFGSVGFYDLDVTVTPFADLGGPHEPNDSILEATSTGLAVSGQATFSGFLGDGRFAATRGDVDCYVIDTVPGDELIIDVDAATIASPLDSVVVVFDYFAREVARNDNDGATTDSLVTASATSLGAEVPTKLYVMVLGARQVRPQDPTTPNPLSNQPLPADHVVTDVASSTGTYDITFTLNGRLVQFDGTAPPPPPMGPPPPYDSDRLFASGLTGTQDLIYELDADSGAAINSFTAPEEVVRPNNGLAIRGDTLYALGAGRYPVLYALDPDTGGVIDQFVLWLGSGYYGDLAALNGLLYISDILDQSVHVFDVDGGVAQQTLAVGSLNAISASGPMTALAHPDRLFMSDYVSTTGAIFAINPANNLVDTSFPATMPCPCLADLDSDGDVDGEDQMLYDACKQTQLSTTTSCRTAARRRIWIATGRSMQTTTPSSPAKTPAPASRQTTAVAHPNSLPPVSKPPHSPPVAAPRCSFTTVNNPPSSATTAAASSRKTSPSMRRLPLWAAAPSSSSATPMATAMQI